MRRLAFGPLIAALIAALCGGCPKPSRGAESVVTIKGTPKPYTCAGDFNSKAQNIAYRFIEDSTGQVRRDTVWNVQPNVTVYRFYSFRVPSDWTVTAFTFYNGTSYACSTEVRFHVFGAPGAPGVTTE